MVNDHQLLSEISSFVFPLLDDWYVEQYHEKIEELHRLIAEQPA